MPIRTLSTTFAAVLLCIGCGPAVRQSLPVPFAPIQGAIPVAQEGIAFGVELADGLRGQEMHRTELTGVVLGGGIENLVGVALGGLRTSDDHVGSTSFRVKIRVARPLGPRSAFAIHLGASGGRRQADTVQNEQVQTVEAALPLEVLATNPDKKVWLSAFVAPRVMLERYTDRLAPVNDVTVTFLGGSTGLHLRAWFLDAFSEITLARVPETVYRGVRSPAALYGFPALNLMVRIGAPYDWKRP